MRRRSLAAGIAVAAAAAGSPGAQALPPELEVSPDDRHVYAGGWSTFTFARDAATGALRQVDFHAPGGRALAIAPDGRHLYSAAPEGVHVLSRDAGTGLLTHETTVVEAATGLAALRASPDGRHLYGTIPRADEIAIFERDTASGALRRTGAVYGGTAPGEVPWVRAVGEIAVAPGGAHAYLAAADGVGVFKRDAATGALEPVGVETGMSTNAADVAVSADGLRVYAGRSDVTVFERDPATGDLTLLGDMTSACDMPPTCNVGWSIAPSPDGSNLFTTRQLERKLVQARVVPEGLAREGEHAYAHAGGHPQASPLELAWSGDSRSLYVAEGRHMWVENGAFFITSPDAFTAIALYRRAPGKPLLEPSGVVRPTSESTPPEVRAPTVTIDDGARFTNSPDVTVRVAGRHYSVRLSNDGSFGGPARRLEYVGRYPWRLEDTGLGRDVRRVHVRFTWTGYLGRPLDVSDDIVLDQTRPTLAAARAHRIRGRAARLMLRARDNRSGVRRVQLTARRARPGRPLRFRRALKVRRLRARSWARVIDGAGNKSRWRRVRLTHQSTG